MLLTPTTLRLALAFFIREIMKFVRLVELYNITFPIRILQVLLGGGRSKFLPVNVTKEGERRDGKNLVKDWKQDKEYRGKAKYVVTREDLLNVDVKHTDYLLGKDGVQVLHLILLFMFSNFQLCV